MSRPTTENRLSVTASPETLEEGAAGPPTKKRHLGTRIWQRMLLGVLVGATRTIRRLSRPAAMRFGARLGGFVYRVAGRQRRYADRNLRLAYGDTLSPDERVALTQRVCEKFGKTVVDFLRVPAMSNEQVQDLVCEVEGREWLEAARADGRGFIIVTGHMGNFELLGSWLATQGVPSTAVARDPADPALAAYLREMRESRGNVILSKGTSARELIGALRRGSVITLGVDQNSGDVFVPFFGVPAGTVTGPARLALHAGAFLLPAFCIREPDDRYRMIFLPPIRTEKTRDREADVIRVTEEISQAVESMVRRYPDQWLWLHNRWKSAFEEKNLPRWPQGYDVVSLQRRWQGE